MRFRKLFKIAISKNYFFKLYIKNTTISLVSFFYDNMKYLLELKTFGDHDAFSFVLEKVIFIL